MAAYVGNNYTAADTSAIVLDLLGTVLVALVAFGSLAGLILLYGWAKKKAPKF